MFGQYVRATVGQSVLLNIIFFGLTLFGALAAAFMVPVDRYPNFPFGEVNIDINYPGAGPQEVEREVLRPIEEALRDLDDLEFLRSDAMFNRGSIHVKFIDDSDYDRLYDELRLRVLGIQNTLPTVNGQPLQPSVNKIETDQWLPVIQVNLVTEPDYPTLDFRTLKRLSQDLQVRLEALPGIKRVELFGERVRQLELKIDEAALRRHRLTFDDVAQALSTAGQRVPGGELEGRGGTVRVLVDAPYQELADVYQVVVARRGDGGVILARDVLLLNESGIHDAPGTILTTANGQTTVIAKILKIASANAIDVKEAVVQRVNEFLALHEERGLGAVYTLDSTTYIGSSMQVLQSSLILALALVMGTLFFFLSPVKTLGKLVGGGLTIGACATITIFTDFHIQIIALAIQSLFVCLTCRAATLTSVGVLFAFLGTMIVFALTGFSLNEISLLGFVLTCGIIVDDAIIVLENVTRHREMGKDLLTSVEDAIREVFWPVISAAATTCAAFLPLLLMTGTVGDFFSLIPIAVATALAISLVECLVFMPLHIVDIERLVGPEKMRHEAHDGDIESIRATPGLVGGLLRVYDRMLGWNLRHPLLASSAAIGLFIGAIGIVAQSAMAPSLGPPLLNLKFFPDDVSVIKVAIRVPDHGTRDDAEAMLNEISRDIVNLGSSKIESVSGIVGMSVDASYRPVFGERRAFLFAALPRIDERDIDDPRQFIHDLRDQLTRDFGEQLSELEVEANRDGPPTGMPVAIRVQGVDDRTVTRAADDLYAWMQSEIHPEGKLQGITNLVHSSHESDRVLQFSFDFAKLNQHQLTLLQAQQAVSGLFDGRYVGELQLTNEELPIRLQMSDQIADSPGRVASIPLQRSPAGAPVRIVDVGAVHGEVVSTHLYRRDFARLIDISGGLSDNTSLNPAAVQRIVQQWWQERADTYPGASVAFGGEAESTARSYQSLALAFLVALILIYAILAGQFKSYLQPFVIITNVGFSFTGVILVMTLFTLLPNGIVAPERTMITVQSFIAIVGLTGLVVNDAIVLIDFINRRRREGLAAVEAAHLAGLQRLRPIIMTTISTIAGLLPMALGIPYFSVTWSPFATTFVAGLLMSTAMTLLLIPVFYQGALWVPWALKSSCFQHSRRAILIVAAVILASACIGHLGLVVSLGSTGLGLLLIACLSVLIAGICWFLMWILLQQLHSRTALRIVLAASTLALAILPLWLASLPYSPMAVHLSTSYAGIILALPLMLPVCIACLLFPLKNYGPAFDERIISKDY
jgi:HAE1 family hydrophobic/amphiphilic exporter-1